MHLIEVLNSRNRELYIFTTHMHNFSVGDGDDFNVRNGITFINFNYH